MKFTAVMIVVWTMLLNAPLAANAKENKAVFTKPTVFETHECAVSLTLNENGGYLTALVSHRQSAPDIRPLLLRDVTGVGILTGHSLIATTSPIYGRPGLYLLDCREGTERLLVAPRTIDAAYPHGADYFELVGRDQDKISYYYTRDVEVTDFSIFRNPKNLRTYQCIKAECDQ